MDITSPTLLKVKAALFLTLGVLAGALVLAPDFEWRKALLLALCVWAFSRAYYFCFYVLHHYVDAQYKYAGLWSALRFLCSRKRPK